MTRAIDFLFVAMKSAQSTPGEASYRSLIVSKCLIYSTLNWKWKSFTPRWKILRTPTTNSGVPQGSVNSEATYYVYFTKK
jgi:hypothetical protein